MNLTKNFTLKELTKTSSKFDNTPNAEEICRLRVLCEKVLQPTRDEYGKPITVNSGFRSYLVNKDVGGVDASQHRKGEAADISAGSKAENKKLFEIIKTSGDYDQLINEYDYSWVHVSYTTRRKNRKQILKVG